MSAALYKAPTQNFASTSLNGNITNSDTSITVNDASLLQAPGYVVIDREDGSGTPTPNAREVVKYTGISTNTLTGCTRGADGSTAAEHTDGALVEPVLTVGMWNDHRDAINAEHTTTGTHVISTASIQTTHTNNLFASSASVGNLNITNEPSGIGGQFYFGRSGALATVLSSKATDTHFPLLRVTKNVTIQDVYVSLVSAPSIATFQVDINFGSSPTGAFSSIFSTNPTIDIGEYDTTTAATPAVISLTSLASGALLKFEIDRPGGAGGMGASLQVRSR